MLPGGGKPERIVSLCRTIKNRDKTLLESISVHVLDRISDLICSLSYSLSCVVFQDIQDTKHLLSRISLDLYMQKKKKWRYMYIPYIFCWCCCRFVFRHACRFAFLILFINLRFDKFFKALLQGKGDQNLMSQTLTQSPLRDHRKSMR